MAIRSNDGCFESDAIDFERDSDKSWDVVAGTTGELSRFMAKGPQTFDSNWGEPHKVERRRACRAPAPVILRLRSDLEPNEQHPLAKLDSTVRDAQRQRLIASILARLANGPIQESNATVTMRVDPHAARDADESSQAE